MFAVSRTPNAHHPTISGNFTSMKRWKGYPLHGVVITHHARQFDYNFTQRAKHPALLPVLLTTSEVQNDLDRFERARYNKQRKLNPILLWFLG